MSTIDDKPLESVLFFAIDRMVRRSKEWTIQIFKEHQFPVTVDQWILLKRIGEDNGLSQRSLAETTFKDPAAVTRIIDILEKKALVQRHRHPEDRRTHQILLTESGLELVKQMTPVVQDIRKKALGDLPAQDLETTRRVVHRMYKNMNGQ
ncbi:MAG: MarR family transcriptional regulator [Bacteroidota bacterium]